MMDVDSGSFMVLVFVAGLIGSVIGMITFGVILGPDISLSQETADDICQQLTQNKTVIADSFFDPDDGLSKLKCIFPSYDSTQNILFVNNAGEKK